MMTHYESSRDYRARKIAAGLCWTCGKEAEAGRKRCRPCIDRANESQRACHARKKESGLCVRCGKDRTGGDTNRCRPCADKVILQKRKRRLECYAAYGGAFCACCGEDTYEFLTIDHIHGGGHQHRESENRMNICLILRRDKYPPGYQVLCYNCNCAKGYFGVCPHQKAKDALRHPVSGPVAV